MQYVIHGACCTYGVRPKVSWDANARTAAHQVDATTSNSSGAQVMPACVHR